ncbi:cleavage and polyadenylation specificity factor subunit 7-like [Eucyclogobius newberryi]|uniref:cleavage and polyadenylation specificity factor subunit 7-like n=1 Tax=Eucyclogobius newberryi TaxID=166745 RepID=UPI003B5A9C3B
MAAAKPAATALECNDEDDLYDAVLTGSVDTENTLPSKQSETRVHTDNANSNQPSETSKYTGGRICDNPYIYIGKFPWWVTEEEILQLVSDVGVQDVLEVKFAEIKSNGLSRGYVKVVVGSKQSCNILMDKVPNYTLGGENIVCQRSSNFEMDKQRFPPDADYNINDSSSYLPQDHQQFFNQFTNIVPPVPNPYPNYPLSLPPIPPPSLLPFMFMNFMKYPDNPQSQNPEIAGTSQRWHSSSSSSTLSSNEKTDKDFEELLNRNKAVASTAISKAVLGATTGELSVAIETLLTAISIIKQSRVYQDGRCKAMVTALKD